MRSLYPIIPSNNDEASVFRWIAEVTRARQVDVSDYQTQQVINTAIYPVPSSMTDLIGTEKAGDIAISTGFVYVVVDNSGVLEWRRAALSTF